VGCGHSGTWAPTCPAERNLVTLTQAHKDQIVNLHNTLRNKIASGLEPGFNAAGRMATMVSLSNDLY
jgi:hypothetical protein